MVKFPHVAPVLPVHAGGELCFDVGTQFRNRAAEVGNVATNLAQTPQAEDRIQAIAERDAQLKLWVRFIASLLTISNVLANVLFVLLLPLANHLKMLVAIPSAPVEKLLGALRLTFFSRALPIEFSRVRFGIDTRLYSCARETKTINSASFFDVTPQTRSAGVVAQQAKLFRFRSCNYFHE